MALKQKTNVNIVFGAMTIGKPGGEQTRVHSLEEASKILDVFQKYGHSEIDTARVYGQGSSEEYLGQLDWKKRGLVIDTKFYPTKGKNMGEDQWTHRPEHLRENLMRSLKALKADKINMWYLHAPDRTTPYEDTLREVNNLHKEGLFDGFGISNYMSWEVAQMCEICDRNGWIKPTVYQGIYNAIHRAVEPELLPCLRKYGISLFNFNPLAGGYLTDRYHRDDKDVEEGSRFDPKKQQGKKYREKYWNDSYFDALDIIRSVAKKHGLTEAECALRWMTNHSQLKREHGDAVIIGASSVKHIEQNLIDLEKGPLPQEVVEALDAAWDRVKGVSTKYHH